MKKSLIIVLTILVILAGGFFLTRRIAARSQATLFEGLETAQIDEGTLYTTVAGAGTVRTNQNATLVWKISGQVDQVNVSPGMQVAAGDVLGTLSKTSLPASIILAQADLFEAQNALDDLYNTQAQQAQALKAVDQAEKALEDALNPEVIQANARAEVALAQEALVEAQRQYDILTAPTPQAAIDQAYGSILLAENKLQETLDLIEKMEWRYTSAGANLPPPLKHLTTDIRKSVKKALEGLEIQRAQDQIKLDNARARYDALLEPPDPIDVMNVEADLLAAQARLDTAQREWERVKDGPSPAEIGVLEAELADAVREWERVKNGPNPDDITVLEAQIAAAQAALSQAQIIAPFDGLISEVWAKPGDQTQAGTLAFRIDDVSHLLVDMRVPEVDINLVEVGQDAVMTFDSVFAKEYHGTVTEVALVGTEVGGLISFEVMVELLDADESIRPGMTAEVNIILRQKDDVLLVPNRAIRVLDGEKVVYRKVDRPTRRGNGVLPESWQPLSGGQPTPNVRPVPITLGETSNLFSEVTGGDLQPGDVVLIDPPEEIIDLVQGWKGPNR